MEAMLYRLVIGGANESRSALSISARKCLLSHGYTVAGRLYGSLCEPTEVLNCCRSQRQELGDSPLLWLAHSIRERWWHCPGVSTGPDQLILVCLLLGGVPGLGLAA